MEVIIGASKEDISIDIAKIIAHQVRTKPDSVLGLATGASPLSVYQRLIDMCREEQLDFSRVRTFNLDEYVGLAGDHPASYRHYMDKNLFDKINIDKSRTYVPNGVASDIEQECASYEKQIAESGGIDLQILGIGGDGHIGFNEPVSSFGSRTRIKTLTERTRSDNSRYFENIEDVPIHVVTMGIGSIMQAGRIILMAFGQEKADAVAKMIEGPITAMVPASALHLHEKVKVFLDAEAASELKKKDYYNWVYSHKPSWQV